MVAVLFNACYYDKADLLYPNTSANCDTATVISYSKKIVPLLQQQCYGCHTGAMPGGGIIMGTYAADYAIAIKGSLYGSVAHTGSYSPMPKGASKLSACNLLLIKRWIDAGSLNN